MDGFGPPFDARAGRSTFVLTASVACDVPDAISKLNAALGPGPFALVVVMASPKADLTAIARDAQNLFGDTPVIGCTTAGEIAPCGGYIEGSLMAFAFPRSHFQAEMLVVTDLAHHAAQDLIGQTIRTRARLNQTAEALENEFAFLLVDGLSLSEDTLASTLATGLGPMPMFGASAGDGTRFKETFVFAQGKVLSDAAILTMLRTDCDVRVFSLNHFHPTDRRMVVTQADPSRRIVHEINAEPAARELARLLGKSPDQIDTFTFAENPMVVRFGGKHHVRAIKRMTPEGDLEFFSAIDEGLVLTLAEAAPMAEHLRDELANLSATSKPDAILAFDCLLRRIEAGQKQQTRDVNAVLSEYCIAGFSTYGEQIGGLHVNQTMTGVAIYPPKATEENA